MSRYPQCGKCYFAPHVLLSCTLHFKPFLRYIDMYIPQEYMAPDLGFTTVQEEVMIYTKQLEIIYLRELDLNQLSLKVCCGDP